MALTLEQLLPDDQQLRFVEPHEPLDSAISIMYQHGYSQLPVTGANGGFQGYVITFELVLQAIQCFRIGADALLVRDASQRVRCYAPDADLLETLDDIHRDNFALIVDDSRLIGIVTTADMAIFFRKYAQDFMVIEGIESHVKDVIGALYANDGDGLASAITAVTDRAADIRKKLPAAIKAYLGKTGVCPPVAATDVDALAEAEKKLGLQEPGKKFENLTFHELTSLLLRHERASKLLWPRDVSELRALLQQVRDARNKLAHFKGELTPGERRTIRFAAGWLEKNLPAPLAEASPLLPLAVASPLPGRQEEGEEPHGSYAPLASFLESQPPDITSLTLTFPQIEGVLKKELPRSASEYRAWWSNDPMTPQSAAWLDGGWRTTSISMTERRLTFVRTDDRAAAYIGFFAKLNARLATEVDFPLRNVSSQGQSWLVLASLDRSRPELATLVASFDRRKRLRIELYLDGGEKDANKQLFDRLLARKSEIEKAVGEPLQWERMENRRACRIAAYTKAQILTDADNPTLLEWATKEAIYFYRAFAPEFPPSRSRG